MPAQLSASPDGTSLAPKALYVEVAERLRQRIFKRELEPGSWIDELRIAEEYGISRTPLREALKVLAAEGLVTMKLRRGAYVTEVSERDLAEVFHLLVEHGYEFCLFDGLNRLGTTDVVATHDLHLLSRVGTAQMMRLDRGRLSDPTGALKYPPLSEDT